MTTTFRISMMWVALAAGTAFAGALPATAPDEMRTIPFIYCSDLFHPAMDPDDHFDLAAVFRLKELDIGTLNNPLTWDELKTMEGKPVWVEGMVLKSAWYLILEFDVDEDMMFCVGRYYERIPLHGDRMGTYWQAYRKERQ